MFLVAWFYSEWRVVRSFPISAWQENPSADCAIVLTGTPSRLKEGLDLLVRKQVKKLIISGVHPAVSLNEIFPNLIYYPELNHHDIILERRSQTTYGNAQQSLPYAEALGCTDIILVTSQLHMSRALRTFSVVFSESFTLVPLTTYSGDLNSEILDVFFETVKSLFYSTWVY